MFPGDLKRLKIVSVNQPYILLYACLSTEFFYYFEDWWFWGGGRILLRDSYQGQSSGLRVRLEGLLKTHYDAYLLPANVYSFTITYS